MDSSLTKESRIPSRTQEDEVYPGWVLALIIINLFFLSKFLAKALLRQIVIKGTSIPLRLFVSLYRKKFNLELSLALSSKRESLYIK